jgi:hypothetical protein
MSDTKTQPPAFELSIVLRQISSHLDGLSIQVQGIESTFGAQLNPGAPPQSGLITQLQSLDYLRQSLQDLAVLLTHLSEVEGMNTVPFGQISKINGILKLSDTKAILMPQVETAGFGKDGSSFGTIDLF